ncbi:MAG: oligosaccharide flippase family protein, partial [Actinomycetota bacterium]|nr:oligosaccharide flippase family protein [Actinomycetota bacterium]
MSGIQADASVPPNITMVGRGHNAPPASLRRNSAARFLADGAGLIFGVVAGVITARWLGPEGKGLFASVTFLAALVMQASSLGLGDAAIVMAGQQRVSLQRALSATLGALVYGALGGMLVFWLAAVVAFGQDWEQARTAVVVASLGIPVSLFAYVLQFILAAEERIVASSTVLAVTSSLTTVGLWLFIPVLDLSVVGGVLGTVLGASGGLILAAWLVRRGHLSLRPRWNRAYIRQAIAYGLTVEASYLVTVMFLRVDLLLVYSLAGSGAAGHYSVALTISTMVALVPIAITHAIFPRLAHVGAPEASALTAQACRLATAAALGAGFLLLVATPGIVPLLFGHEFRPAVVATVIMIPGSILWSAQWLLCRAEAARGRPGLLLVSFASGLSVMIGGDLVLIPPFGIVGAALASVAGPVAGLLICVVQYHRSPEWPLPLTQLVPRADDA